MPPHASSAILSRAAWLPPLLGRALIALLFIPAGALKFIGPAPFETHMAAHGVPILLLPLAGALELGAGFAILTGLLLRPAAGALGLFCVATALLFHADLSDHAERSLFAKDLALAGGLFILSATQNGGPRLRPASRP